MGVRCEWHCGRILRVFSSRRSLLEVVAQAWSLASIPSVDVYLHESRRLVLRFVWLRATEGKDKGCVSVIQVD